MSDDRDAARPTPYHLIFGAPAFEEARFELIREQAAERRAVTPTELFMLPAAGTLQRELLPADADPETHRELVAQMSVLLFHAFRFWLHGRTVYELTESAARALVAPGPLAAGWHFRAPSPAGYVQLPRNLFWARVADDAAPEPVDGFFWSAPSADEGGSAGRLDILLALGVRRRRPGLSLVDASVETGETLQQWADVNARPGGTDFENVLPGGELQGYHSLTTMAEVLKLAARCFWRIDTGDVVEAGDDAPSRHVIDG
jgi:hypothetical protein